LYLLLHQTWSPVNVWHKSKMALAIAATILFSV